jgi:hypothetical protein
MSQAEKAMAPCLDVERIVWQRFGCLEPSQPEWLHDLAYWEDYAAAFFRSNGRTYGPERSNVRGWLEAADRAPFVRMADVLLTRLASQADLRDVDFVLFAHWLPDLHLGTSVTNFAMHRLGLRTAFGFAISDRGLAAPFVAFDCIDRFLQDEGRKALLMIMDQKHLLYRSRARETLDPDNNACMLLLARRPTRGFAYLGYRRLVLEKGSSMHQTCRALLDAFSLRGRSTTIVTADPLLASFGLSDRTVMADRRLVCAAPFAALAEARAPGRDCLLLARDGQAVCGVAFRFAEA